MKITYDPNIKLAGIAIVPWNRLGPEQYFPSYAIASLYGWDINPQAGLPRLFALEDQPEALPKLRRLSTGNLLKDPSFQQLLDSQLPGYDLLTYKPAEIPPELTGRRVLSADESFTVKFENKANFRQLFGKGLPFPEYQIYDRSELESTEASFRALIGSSPKVIQDEQLIGGKGSFVVRDFADYRGTIKSLDELSTHERVVVSRYIEPARERTIQACVTKDGVFAGPLQRQLVGHPLLTNKLITGGNKFCGVQILAADQDTKVHHQAGQIAQEIGQVMAGEGYRGIFGVDFLLDEDNNLYILEVNPRLTGVTPLLTALFKDEDAVPFYLLHILELGGYPYEITDKNATFNQTGALLITHSLEMRDVEIANLPPSGTYKLDGDSLSLVSPNLDLKKVSKGQFIIQDYMNIGSIVKPGGRVVTLQFHEQILDEKTDELYNSTINVISAVQKRIIL